MSALEQVRNLEGSSELKTAVMLYGDEQMCADEAQREEAEEAAKEYLDLLERVKELEGVLEGVQTCLKYPRGSEAQVRCLEEVGQDAERLLKGVK